MTTVIEYLSAQLLAGVKLVYVETAANTVGQNTADVQRQFDDLVTQGALRARHSLYCDCGENIFQGDLASLEDFARQQRNKFGPNIPCFACECERGHGPPDLDADPNQLQTTYVIQDDHPSFKFAGLPPGLTYNEACYYLDHLKIGLRQLHDLRGPSPLGNTHTFPGIDKMVVDLKALSELLADFIDSPESKS